MKLDISGRTISNSTLEQIVKVIHDEKSRGDFFILIKDEHRFLQATGPNDQFIVEYREDAKSDMYSASNLLTCAELQELCQKYFVGDPNWSTDHEWNAMGFI